MARRRVNLQFLLIVSGIILGGAVLALAAKRYLFKENPKRYIDQAHRDMREGKIADARFNFEKALSLDAKDPNLNVEMADCLHELTRLDPNVIGLDRKYYMDALSLDPTYRPALQKLMRLEIEAVEYDPRPEYFNDLHKLAQKVISLPPYKRTTTEKSSKEEIALDLRAEKEASEALDQAKAYVHISTLAGWVMGIIHPDEEIADEMKQLEGLQKTDPGNADIPYYLANAYIKQARELKVQGKDKEQDANVLFDKAVAVFDQALQNQPSDEVLRKDLTEEEQKDKSKVEDHKKKRNDKASLYIRFYTVLRYANQLVAENDLVPDKQVYVEKMRYILEAARKFVLKDDAAFTEVYIQSSQFALRHDEPGEAEKLLRELVSKRPDDQTARLALAELLHPDPTKRPEMIDLLKKDITDPGMAGVVAVRNKKQLELQTYLDLSKYLIEQWYVTSDPAARQAIRADIDRYYQRLAERQPLHYETLKLKAKLVLLTGGPDAPINAIPIIEQGINSFNVLTASAGNPNRKEWELEFMLARCYFDSHQTGEARVRLTKITDNVPLYSPAHLLLAQLLIEGRDLDQAQEQIKILQKLTPDDPAVNRLQMAYLSLAHREEELAPQIDQMAEKTVAEKKSKAQLYLMTKHEPQALRLLLQVLAEKPADFEAVDAAARLYWRTGQKKEAVKLVETAAQEDPANLQLNVLLVEMKGEKPEVIMSAMSDAINAIKDDFAREMKWFDFYFAQNNTDEAVKHLTAAEKLKPTDNRVLDLRFQYACNDHNWASAESYIAKLAANNSDQANGRIYRYRLALAKQDIPAAAEVAQDLVKALPQYARSWLCLADVQRMQNQQQEAVNNYMFALQKQPANLDAFRGIIECYYALNKPSEALQYIVQGLRQNPGNTYLSEEKVKYDLAYGEPKDAIAPRLAYRDSHPENAEAWLMLGGAYLQVAQRLTDTNKLDTAKEYVKLALDTFTKGSAKWPDEKLFYAYLADLATFTHDVPAGEKALQALAARPAFAEKVEPRLLLADYYQRTGQVEQAEKVMKEAVSLAKNTDEAKQKTEVQQKLAAFYAQQGKFDLALGELDENSADVRVQLQRVETFVAAGKMKEAQSALQKLLVKSPKDPQLLAMNGFLLVVDQKPVEAMKVLNEALSLDPKNQTALYQRGRLFLSQGTNGVENAVRDLTAARDLNTKNVQTRLALAEAFLMRNDNDSCIHEMTEAMRAQPTNKDIRMKLLELLARQTPPRWMDVERLIKDARDLPEFIRDPDWSRAEANMWLARKDFDKALKSMEACLKLATQIKLPPDRMGPLQQDYLNVLVQGKKYNELLANTNALLADARIAESIWWVYQLRAIAYRNLDQPDKALADFDQAIKIATKQKNDEVVMMLIDSIAETVGTKPAIERLRQKIDAGETHWRITLAYLYLKSEDYLNAVTLIDKALAESESLSDRDRDAALDIAGLVYMQAREYSKAIDVYQKILARTPDNLGALNNLAFITGELKENPQPKEALRYSQKAMELLDQRGVPDANITDTHGWMLTLDKQYDEGIKFLRMALDRQPFPECEYHLAFALLQKNQPTDAIVELEKAKQLNEDRKKKSQKVDAKLEAKIEESLTKAKQMAAVTP